jgi:hypothetical protein
VETERRRRWPGWGGQQPPERGAALTQQRHSWPKPVFQLTSEEAHAALVAWCRDNGYRLIDWEKWTRWLDLPRPCWATRAVLVRLKSMAYLEFGVQVYEEGEVLAFRMR